MDLSNKTVPLRDVLGGSGDGREAADDDTTGVRSLTRRLTSKFQRDQSWPNPGDSTGVHIQRLGRLLHCWEAIGPARELFDDLAEVINAYLMKSSDSVSFTVTWSLYMVGRTPEAAKPTIAFCSKDGSSRKRIRSLIEESGLLKDYPGFATMDCNRPPGFSRLRPLSGDSSERHAAEGDTYIRWRSSLQGASILYAEQAEPLHLKHIASVGGAIYRDGRPFLLTVAHAFHGKQDHLFAEVDVTDEFEFDIGQEPSASETATLATNRRGSMTSVTEYGDDISIVDNYSLSMASPSDPSSRITTQDYTDSDLSHLASSSSRLLPTIPQQGLTSFMASLSVPDQPESQPHSLNTRNAIELRPQSAPSSPTLSKMSAPAAPRQLLHSRGIAESSKDSSNPHLDYALIPVDNASVLKELRTSRTHDIAPVPRESVEVLIGSASQGNVEGRLLGIPTYASGSQRYGACEQPVMELWTVKLEKELKTGDCGSWVWNVITGELYGHIVAGSSESDLAYVVPAHLILQDIKARFSGDWRLSSDQYPETADVGGVPGSRLDARLATPFALSPHQIISRPSLIPSYLQSLSIEGSLPVDVDCIAHDFFRIFSILLSIGRGAFIASFARKNTLSDLNLPFGQGDSLFQIPEVDGDDDFIPDFLKKQRVFTDAAALAYLDPQDLPDTSTTSSITTARQRAAIWPIASPIKAPQPTSESRTLPLLDNIREVKPSYHQIGTHRWLNSRAYLIASSPASEISSRSSSPALTTSAAQAAQTSVVLMEAGPESLESIFRMDNFPLTTGEASVFWLHVFGITESLQFVHDEWGFTGLYPMWHGEVSARNAYMAQNDDARATERRLRLSIPERYRSENGQRRQPDQPMEAFRSRRADGAFAVYSPSYNQDSDAVVARQRTDVLALLELLWEAAVWVSSGYVGLSLYRRQRQDGKADWDRQKVLRAISQAPDLDCVTRSVLTDLFAASRGHVHAERLGLITTFLESHLIREVRSDHIREFHSQAESLTANANLIRKKKIEFSLKTLRELAPQRPPKSGPVSGIVRTLLGRGPTSPYHPLEVCVPAMPPRSNSYLIGGVNNTAPQLPPCRGSKSGGRRRRFPSVRSAHACRSKPSSRSLLKQASVRATREASLHLEALTSILVDSTTSSHSSSSRPNSSSRSATQASNRSSTQLPPISPFSSISSFQSDMFSDRAATSTPISASSVHSAVTTTTTTHDNTTILLLSHEPNKSGAPQQQQQPQPVRDLLHSLTHARARALARADSDQLESELDRLDGLFRRCCALQQLQGGELAAVARQLTELRGDA